MTGVQTCALPISKLDEAEKLGIEVIDEKEFLKRTAGAVTT